MSVNLKHFNFTLSHSSAENEKQRKNKIASERNKEFLKDQIDLNSPKISEFQKMRLVIQHFDNVKQFKPGYIGKERKKKLEQLINAATQFSDDYNFQYRFLIIALRLSMLENNLADLNILKLAVKAFKKFSHEEIIFSTAIELLHSQSKILNLRKYILIVGENCEDYFFNCVLDSVTKYPRIDQHLLLKCYEILIVLFDRKCLDLPVDSKWLVENGTNCLILSRNWAKSTNQTNTYHFIHFLLILSRHKQFLPFLSSKLKLLLDGFGDFLLEILNLFENMLNVSDPGVFPENSDEFLKAMTHILLCNASRAEIFIKTITLFLRCYPIFNEKLTEENFIKRLISIVKLHFDRKLILPRVCDLMHAIYLRQISEKLFPVNGILKTDYFAEEFLLSVENENSLVIKNKTNPFSVPFSQIDKINFSLEKTKQNFGFEFDKENLSPSENGFMEIRLFLLDENAVIKQSNFSMYFQPKKEILCALNPLVELLMRLRELNYN